MVRMSPSACALFVAAVSACGPEMEAPSDGQSPFVPTIALTAAEELGAWLPTSDVPSAGPMLAAASDTRGECSPVPAGPATWVGQEVRLCVEELDPEGADQQRLGQLLVVADEEHRLPSAPALIARRAPDGTPLEWSMESVVALARDGWVAYTLPDDRHTVYVISPDGQVLIHTVEWAITGPSLIDEQLRLWLPVFGAGAGQNAYVVLQHDGTESSRIVANGFPISATPDARVRIVGADGLVREYRMASR